MIYNILAIGDLHFGAMDPDIQYCNLYPVIETIHHLGSTLDMVVICGDYYDYSLPLNSKSAIRALEWFDTLINICLESGVKRVRVYKGTEEHDHNQLEALRIYESYGEKDFLKIFNINTVEETLPGLKCIYCPDENLYEKDYCDLYLENMLSQPDIGFFHGSFDVVLPSIALDIREKNQTQNIVFYLEKWAKLINGPLISAHWHDAYEDDPLIYLGSFDRWAFGEEADKGLGIIRYDTETHQYAYSKVKNPFATEFTSFKINTFFYHTHMDYSNFAEKVEEYISRHSKAKIRITIEIGDESDETDDYIKALQQRFTGKSRRVKFNIVNTIQKKKKAEMKKETAMNTEQFQYIFDKGNSIEHKLQKYILDRFGVSLGIDEISECIKKYLPDK